MYPNIILTNRLQPDAMVTDAQCATCDFNDGAESECQRRMQWSWRGELMVSTRGEYNMIRNQLEQEKFPPKFDKGADRFYHELPKTEQESILKKRLSDYTRKIYGKLYTNKIIEKTSIVCQRENPFYIDTVRNFRDRRYDYKALLKEWKQKLDVASKAEDASGIDEAARMIVIFDSLQLAHKCILNSFYGYVMRKGARWYSMEMAGIVCLTGAKIIQLARSRVEKIGRPLELDTDGIWCILPASFPENFIFKLRNGKSYSISYPCVMLNHLVHDQFTNHQYMDLVNPTTFDYKSRKENSIFFEVDGPYRAMILPASTEEDKLLKKRYAVFNHDGTLAELKGFEIKRRGELKLIKNFQGSIFKVFLEGDTLENCYKAVATIANQWIDILDSKGQNITDNELFDLLTENRSMSKALSEYGSQKSTSITAAKRLAELLGDHMVSNSGTACKFIISASPNGAPVSERAVPIAIFYLDGDTRRKFLSKWLKESVQDSEDVRDILDWDYYLERFGSVIQKLITIPAASQSVQNPVPRIKHPEWLQKRLASLASKSTQRLITDMLSPVLEIPRDLDCPTSKKENVPDLEDIGYTRPLLPNGKRHLKTPLVMQKRRKKQTKPLHPELVSENPHDFRTNYRLWLSAQKPIWIRRLKDKLNSAAKLRLGQQTKLSAYFAQNVINMENQTWKVLQVSDTDSQGIFRLWVSINGHLEGVDIDVPRVIYINSKIDDLSEYLDVQSMQITKVNRKLPRGHISYTLFEISMSEYTYKINSGKLSSMFQEKFVAGVYETQVPLDFRVLIELGLYVKPKMNRESLDRTVPLPFGCLEQVSQKSSNYLTVSDLDIMYLYHSRSGSRHFMCLFFVATGEVYIEVVDTNKKFEVPDVARRIYKEFADQNEPNSFFPTTISVSTTSWTNESNLFSSINGKILAFKRKNGKLPVILFQATNTPKYYRNNGFSSMREIPYLVVPNHKSDDIFPALSWAQFCITRMTGHFFNLDAFLQEKFHLACFSNVPVCNIENDSAVFLSDLFLARRLKSVDYLLWASPSPKPDLGGSEQDDHRSFLEEFNLPEINNTSAYPNICIDMEIWDLALNTLLKCVDFGNEMEALNHGKSTKTNLLDDALGINKKSMLAEMETPQNAITQIKGMIKDWVQQVRYGNKFASQLLEHLHRWLTNRNSLFYDGLVVGHLLKLMKRCLGSLLSELRKLGCTIVYASFDRLVVETNKNAAPLGLAYFSYVLMTLTKNPTFEHIELKPVGVWDFLLWYDKNNFSTFSCNEILDDSFALSKDSDVDSKLEMNWSVLDYLPPVIQSHLLQSFAQFLLAAKKMKKGGQDHELSRFIESDMKRTLLGRVRDILHRKYDEESELSFEQQYAFPTLPGIEKEPMEPALEFIKIITMVIGLNRQLGNETRLLKRDLLKLVDITEFSEKAKFSNPVQKYVLKQVICDYCNYCSDLDLTQKTLDSDFLHCQGCTMVYNIEEVEQLLIQELTGVTTLWQLQDLVCQTCKQIRSELIPEYCIRCSGKVDAVMQKNEQEQKIKLLSGIAKFYRMQDLLEVCSFYLDSKAVENGNIIN